MKLETFLDEHGVKYHRHTHAKSYTAQSLAHAEHVSGYMVAKPVVVKTPSGFAMCVVAAPKHLDLERAAYALGEPHARLATEAEMADLFPDCELGAEPPVGAMFGMRTVMDEQLVEDDWLVMQAGTHTESVEMSRVDWERVCDPIVASITTH